MENADQTGQILSGFALVARSKLEEAFTVPPAIYSDAGIAKREEDRILRSDWLCPGPAVAPEVMKASGTGMQKWLADTLAFFGKVNAEDKFVFEGIHRGSASPLARSGPVSWVECEIHDVAKYMDRKLNGSQTAALWVAAE